MGVSQAKKELLVRAISKNDNKNLLNHNETAIVDSGCTVQFLLINDPCCRKTKYINKLRLRMPNGDTMDSTNIALLDIPDLSKASLVAHISPDMTNNSLISVVQLYNEGYYITFNIDGVKIFNSEGKSILKGHRYLDTGLCHINLYPNNQQNKIDEANNVYELCNTGALVNYLHKALFRTTKSSLLKAIRKFAS